MRDIRFGSIEFLASEHIGAEMARNAGELRYFVGLERSADGSRIWSFTWTFSDLLRRTRRGEISQGSVRDAEVPGSNPGSPTQESLFRIGVQPDASLA